MVEIYGVNGNERTPIGRMDEDGWVYFNGECVGNVDQYGVVYDGPFVGGPFGGLLGLVDSHGQVYDDQEIPNRVGRVDDDGMVYDSADDAVGRVEGEPKYYAGAALLLLRDKLVKQ